MALNIKTPDISPKEAFSRIWTRLRKAVEEGKAKVSKTAKTEAVMEGVGDLDDEYGDNDLFSDEVDSESHAVPEQNGVTASESEYGDEDLFSEQEPGSADYKPSKTNDIKDTIGANGHEGQSVPEVPSTFALKKPVRPSKAEQELNAKRMREYEAQLNAQWSYSVAEVMAELTSIFRYATENRQYLENSGPLITEPELRAIFFAEYQNYAKGGDLKSNAKALAAVPGIFDRKFPWFLAQFDERLHGRGNFLEKGSLMHYLLRLGNKETTRTAQIRKGANLNVGGEEGICNFIIARDLVRCESWVESRVGGHDMPSSAKQGLALDILVNGLNKPEILQQVGGVSSKMYRVPKYGSLERRGDNVCVIGSQAFLDEFRVRFGEFLRRSEVEDNSNTMLSPATNNRGEEIGRGLQSLAYPEKPYLELINDAVDAGLFIPIAFSSGTTSIDSTGSAATTGDGTRRQDVLQTHRQTDTVESNDYSVGEQLTTENLLDVMEKPGFAQLAGRYGLGDLHKEILDLGEKINAVNLSKLTSALLKIVADRIGITSQIVEKQSIYAVKLGTERSIARLAAEKEGLTPSESRALLAVVTFNNVILDRVSKIEAGHDIGDISKMSSSEMKKNAMPSIYFGKLAELAMTGNYPDKDVLDYAKGYLINALGTSVGFDTSSGQIFSNAADFCRTMGIPATTGEVILREIAQLDTDSLPLYAQKFEEKAEGSVGYDTEDGEGANFYDEKNGARIDHLASTDIARAITKISDDEPGRDVIMRAAEIVTGLGEGFLSKYLEELNAGNNEAVASMAAEIKRTGSGIVTLALTNTSDETFTRTNAAAKQKSEAERRRAIRRNRWK